MKKLVNTFIKTTLKRKKMYRRKTQCSMSAFIKHKKCHVIRKKIQSGWNPPSTHLRNGANCSFFGVFFLLLFKNGQNLKDFVGLEFKNQNVNHFLFFFFTYIHFVHLYKFFLHLNNFSNTFYL